MSKMLMQDALKKGLVVRYLGRIAFGSPEIGYTVRMPGGLVASFLTAEGAAKWMVLP